MKTRSLSIALALMITATASLVAQNPSPSFEVRNQEGSSIYKLVYKAPGTGRVNLKISNESGTLYAEQLSYTDQFIYPLDFKGMKKGEYTFTVSDKKGKFVQTVQYNTKLPLAYVHVAKQPDEKYLLSIKSQAPSDFTVRIFDRWNREVFLKDENVTDEYALVYNLSKLAGPFNFEVTNASGEVAIIQH